MLIKFLGNRCFVSFYPKILGVMNSKAINDLEYFRFSKIDNFGGKKFEDFKFYK